MRINGRRRRVAGFIVLGACLVALAAALNVSWIMVNWREGAWLILGILLFPLIIAGLVLNTVFLVREIRRNEQHNAFINAVTHELKTPIASIRLYLETLQSRAVEDHQREEFYRTMLADSDRLLDTVDQILRTGRAGHRTRPVERQQFDLAELARECALQVRHRYVLPPGSIEIATTREAEPAMVRGDADELRAAVKNLLDNAVKYSSGEGREPQIRVKLEAESQRMWRLCVADNGIGIPAPELRAIFKRFYRVPNQSFHAPGTGLGLFIARSVIRRHRGKIIAESAGPGCGTTFTVRLPRSIEPAPSSQAQPPGERRELAQPKVAVPRS